MKKFGFLILVALVVYAAEAAAFNPKHVHSALVEPNAQLIELENIERDPTQFYFAFVEGDWENGLLNLTQRSPCFNTSSPDCGKQAQDTTILMNVNNGLVTLAGPIINNPSDQSFGFATDGLVYGTIEPNGETYIFFSTLLRILRTIGATTYDTLLYIPSELFGKFNMNNGHFKGHVLAMTVPYLKVNGVSDGLPYQQLATWSTVDTSESDVARLAGYRALTPYPGLTSSPYTPAASYFVQGSIVNAQESKGVYRASANLSTLSGLVSITGSDLTSAIQPYYRNALGELVSRAWVRYALVEDGEKLYFAVNMRLVIGC